MKLIASLALALMFASALATVVRENWYDAARKRTVPVRMMIPSSGAAPYPVVIFSHGLGGSREAATYLGDALTAHGYFVIYVQHPGSDTSVWSGNVSGGREAMLQGAKGAANGQQLVARAQDIHFLIDELTRRNQSDPRLKGKLDLSKIAMTGHSFGAGTTLAVAGQKYPRSPLTGKDERIKCAIYYSPPVSPLAVHLPAVYSDITIPGMVMTGTEDNSPIGETKAENRRVPFDAIPQHDQYLVNFIGGDHMIFGGRTLRREKDAYFHERITKLTVAFLDAYLRGNQQQREWLKKDAANYLADSAKFESK